MSAISTATVTFGALRAELATLSVSASPSVATIRTSVGGPPAITEWLSLGIGFLAILGTALSVFLVYRGYRMNQLLAFAKAFEEQEFFTRFWWAEMSTRNRAIVIGLGDPPVRFFWSTGATFGIPERGGRTLELEMNRDAVPWAVLTDLLGPGFAQDASRADMVNFHALAMRIAYWLGIDGWWPGWVKRGRARQVVRVFGNQLLVTVNRHRQVACRMVYMKLYTSRDQEPTWEETWDFSYYPKAYGVFDPSYGRFLSLLLNASKKREFGAMGEGTAEVEQFSQAVEDAQWPEAFGVTLRQRDSGLTSASSGRREAPE